MVGCETFFRTGAYGTGLYFRQPEARIWPVLKRKRAVRSTRSPPCCCSWVRAIARPRSSSSLRSMTGRAAPPGWPLHAGRAGQPIASAHGAGSRSVCADGSAAACLLAKSRAFLRHCRSAYAAHPRRSCQSATRRQARRHSERVTLDEAFLPAQDQGRSIDVALRSTRRWSGWRNSTPGKAALWSCISSQDSTSRRLPWCSTPRSGR